MQNRLIIISGPAASGKNTVVSRILKEHGDKFEETVSCTSRPPREREIDGDHYYFISKSEFEEKIKNDEFYEWAVVHGDIYFGTLKSELERIFKKGKTPILVIDVQGALNVKNIHEDVLTVFIMPEEISIIEKRLRARGHHSEEDLKNRLESASKEINLSKEYDYIVENKHGEVEKTVEKILQTITD